MISVTFIQNPTQVATSLQVFHNLGSLHHTVERVLQNCRENLNRNVRSCLDAQSLAQQHAPQGRGQSLTHLLSNLVALYARETPLLSLSLKRNNCNSTLVSSCWCTVKPCCFKHSKDKRHPPPPRKKNTKNKAIKQRDKVIVGQINLFLACHLTSKSMHLF